MRRRFYDDDDYGDYLYHKRRDEEAEAMTFPKDEEDENGSED